MKIEAETVRALLADIDDELSKLTALRQAITDFFGGNHRVQATATPSPSAATEPKTERVAWKKLRVRESSRVITTSKPRSGVDSLEICRRLTEPFTPTDLAKASGLSKKGANSACFRWKVAGFIERVGFGAYKRTRKFPGAGSAPAPAAPKSAPVVSVPKSSKDRAKLQEELENAMRQRDYARGQNRQTMVDIFQKDIDRLTLQLKSME